MAKKILSVRVEDELLQQINYFGAINDLSQAEFVTLAIQNLVETIRTERAGGVTIKLPNPNIFLLADKTKDEILKLLNDTNYTLTNITHSGIDLGFNLIKQFAENRLKRDSEADKKRYIKNMELDCNFLNSLKGGE